MSVRNTIFEASAGTGKTYQVTNLYQALLLGRRYPGDGQDPVFEGDPVDCRKILMLTFARNAAAEMRTRIVEGIERELADAPPEEEAKYWRILRALSGAHISTIHAYTRRLLVENALLAGVSPSVALMEETAAEELFAEVIEQHLLESLRDANEAMRESLELLCLNHGVRGRGNADGVIEITMKFIQKARAWGLALDEMSTDKLAALAAEPEPPGIGQLVQLHEDLSFRIPADGRGPAMQRLLDGLRSATNDLDEESSGVVVAERAGKLRAQIKGAWGRDDSVKAARQSAIQTLEDIRAYPGSLVAREHLVAFLQFAAGGHRAFRERKLELGVLDYDDVILRSLELLLSHEIVNPGFSVIIVDEAQDNSRVQNELVECLAKRCGATVILCGDWKQSIHTWRGADPGGLQRLADRIEQASDLLRRALSTSYRSQKDLLAWINHAMSREWVFGEKYRDADALRPRDVAEKTGGPNVELLLPPWEYGDDPLAEVQVPRGGKKNDVPTSETKRRFEIDKKDLRQLAEGSDDEVDWVTLANQYGKRRSMEARAVARRIKLLCSDCPETCWRPAWAWDNEEGQWKETGGNRRYHYRDVLVLLRATTNQSLYETALREAGIRYTTGGKGRGFLFRQEVRDLAGLVAWLAWPLDDLSLVALARSPLVGLSDPAIALLSIRHGASGRMFRYAMSTGEDQARENADRLCSAGLGDDAERYLAGLDLLHRLRGLTGRLPAVELVREAIALTGYDATLAGGFHGQQKLANMRKLLSMLQDIERRENLDLPGVARWLGAQVGFAEAPDAVVFDPEDDAVTISTVHAAKGLTSPVVIIPDLGRSRRKRTSRLLLRPSADQVQSVALKLAAHDSEGNREERSSCDYEIAERENDDRELKELRRLFYVATTRPRDLLLLSGDATTNDTAWRNWINRQLGWMLDHDEDVGALLSLRSYEEVDSAYKELQGSTGPCEPPSVDALATADAVCDTFEVTRYRLPVTRLVGFPRLPKDNDEKGLARFEEEVRTYRATRLTGLAPAWMSRRQEDGVPPDEITDYAERGTVGHEVLEHLDFCAGDGLDASITEALEAATRGGDSSADLTPGLASAARHLVPLLENADHVIRELPFAARFEHNGHSCIVDGKIDLLFFRGGTWHIIDYKFVDSSHNELHDKYALQLQVYGSVLEQASSLASGNRPLVEVGESPTPVAMSILGISRNGVLTPVDISPAPSDELAATVVNTARSISAVNRGAPLPSQ